jgi:hypothetical protein
VQSLAAAETGRGRTGVVPGGSSKYKQKLLLSSWNYFSWQKTTAYIMKTFKIDTTTQNVS